METITYESNGLMGLQFVRVEDAVGNRRHFAKRLPEGLVPWSAEAQMDADRYAHRVADILGLRRPRFVADTVYGGDQSVLSEVYGVV